jgi:hypothetical protein
MQCMDIAAVVAQVAAATSAAGLEWRVNRKLVLVCIGWGWVLVWIDWCTMSCVASDGNIIFVPGDLAQPVVAVPPVPPNHNKTCCGEG